MSEFKEWLGKMSRQEQEQLLALETLPGHLAESTQGEKLYQLLTDFYFIEAKLDLLGVQSLIEDYDLATYSNVLLSPEQTEILKLIQGAIRKSARVLDKDKTQLVAQLLNNPVTLFYDGLLLAEQGQHKTALLKLIEVAELTADVPVVWFELGKVLWCLQLCKEAVASFDKAIKIEGENRDFWFYRGLALIQCGSQDAVRASWERAMSVEPDDWEFWYKQGIFLSLSKCYEAAISCFDLALQIQPNDASFWQYRGAFSVKAGRAEEAIFSYDRALELTPNDCIIWDNRASTLVTLGRYQEAIDNLDKTLEMKPKCHYTYYRKACIYALQKNVELSLENLQCAIRLKRKRYRELAKTDADFDGIRGDVRFQELLLG